MSKGLLRSSLVFSSMTMISRLLGLVRDVVLAELVGASALADVFLLAQKIPNFLRRLFAEGAFAQAFVPVLNETLSRDGRDGVIYLVDRVAGTLGVVLLLITTLAVAGAPVLAVIFGGGFIGDPVKFPLLVLMIKITFPYLIFISLTAFAGGILNTYNQFAVPAITPIFLNISLIVAVLVVAPNLAQPVMALPWAVLAAGIIQLLFQLPFLWRLGILPRPRWGWHNSGVQKILRLLTPALFGVSVTQINLLLDSLIASFLVTGSISWLYYSDRLLEFPLGIFGIGIATVILPNLSRKHAEASSQEFSRMLDWGAKLVVAIGLPAALALGVLAEPLMLTLFQRGAFTLTDASRASYSLIAYAVGLNAFMLVKVFSPGFYARQDTRTPVRIGIRSMMVNMLLNGLFFYLFRPYGLGHMGLALATSLAAVFNAFSLFRELRKADVFRPQGWRRWSMQVVLSCTLMAVVIIVLSPGLEFWQISGAGTRLLWLLMITTAGLVSYLLAMFVFGVRVSDLRH